MKRVNLINSHDYWAERESEALKHYITDEDEYNKQIEKIYSDMLDNVQKEIESFYGRYASSEGITIAEAKKRVSKMDIAAYERKAAKYVAEKNFSKQANEEMRLYNLTMKINRLEMLKANIGLELIAGHDELDKFMGDILQGRTEAELNRQAGILGKTIRNNAQNANAIVNGSFHNATFSDRIWQYQDLMRQDIGKLLQTGLIQGKNPRALTKDLKKYWYGNDPLTGKGQVYCMERLMRTELARVQTEAQKQSFIRNGFDEYEFITNGGCCDICKALDGKHFKVSKMMPGENAPPMHPNCVLPGTKIIAPDMEAMTKSEYSGYIVEIGTANGTRLSVTANHIVLTARGWVRAKNIVKGDKVIYYSGWAESVIESNPANSDCIPAVEELFASLVKSSPMPPLRVPVSAEDFKGDVIPNSKVDVVFINGELRDKIDSTARKLVSDVLLIGADKGCKGILPGNCSLAKFLMGAGLVADGIMSGLDVAGVLFGGSVSHHELVCLRRPSDYDSRLFKTAIDNGTADTKFFSDGVLTDSRCVHFNDTVNVEVDSNSIKLNTAPSETPFNRAFVDAVNIGDLLSAFSGFVSFDDVVFVSNKFYSGHVYDASSLSTLYIANGILSSNCRCSTAAYIDSKEYEEWLDYLDKGGTTVSWNERKKALANSKNRSTIKEIRANSMKEAVSGGPIREDVADRIYSVLSEHKADHLFNKTRTSKLGRGVVFQTDAEKVGTFFDTLFVMNEDMLGGKSVEEIGKMFANTNITVANSLDDAVVHEMYHAKLIYGLNYAQLEALYDELSGIHIHGISQTAESDGAECIAEIGVLIERGDRNNIPKEALDLFYKYIGG